MTATLSQSPQYKTVAPIAIEVSVQPNWERDVIAPLRAEQPRLAAIRAEQARVAEEQAQAEAAKQRLLAEQAAYKPPQPVYSPVTYSQPATTGGLMGSIGYANPYGNCVDEPGVNNPHNNTNPISWAVLFSQPSIGATALFHFNHTGVVTGIWSNGDIEVRHQNFGGGQHRFPAGAIRGYR